MTAIACSYQPRMIAVSTTEVELSLRADRLYSLYHTGKDDAGAASTVDVFGQCDGEAVVTTYAAAEGKIVIQSGVSVPLPPTAGTVKLKTASGTVALMVIASEKLQGGVS